jgi:hypothetical protein
VKIDVFINFVLELAHEFYHGRLPSGSGKSNFI